MKRAILFALAFALTFGIALAAHAQEWQGYGPPPEFDQSAVIDTSNEQVCIFGGTDGTNVFSQVWCYAATATHNMKWTLVSAVQGGNGPVKSSRPIGDSFVGNDNRPSLSNRQVEAASFKIGVVAESNSKLAPPRTGAPGVWDPVNKQTIVEGGQFTWGTGTSFHEYSDNHVFNFNPSTMAYTHQLPESRYAATMVQDSTTGELVAFGGSHSPTWPTLQSLTEGTLDSGADDWTAIVAKQASQGPPGLFGHAAAMNSTTGVMTITLGATTWPGSGCQNQTYQLTGTHGTSPTWIQPPMLAGITPRVFQASAYDPASDTIIVFGGYDCSGNYLGDTWLERGATGANPSWTELLPSGSFPEREKATMIYDSVSNQALVFGGDTGANGPFFNDLWILSNANGTGGASLWTELQPSGILPSPRSGQWMVFDPDTGAVYMSSGTAASGKSTTLLSDTWQLTGSLTGSPMWQQLATTGSLLKNSMASAVLVAGNITTCFGEPLSLGLQAQYFSVSLDSCSLLPVAEGLM